MIHNWIKIIFYSSQKLFYRLKPKIDDFIQKKHTSKKNVFFFGGGTFVSINPQVTWAGSHSMKISSKLDLI